MANGNYVIMYGTVEPTINKLNNKQMNVLVLGAGRMGMRHCLGVLNVTSVKKLIIVDVNQDALTNAKKQLENKNNGIVILYYLWNDFFNLSEKVDIAIIATTAGKRIETCEQLLKFKPDYFLIEKPLGQSVKQVEELILFFDKHKTTKAFVNLNTRLYPAYQKLKEDLKSLPQFKGCLTFSINTGTVGIGANGIHYIDLIKFLTGAEKIKISAASINESIIPSGRGANFADFGGYAVMDYLNNNGEKLATCHFILGSESTVLGPWEIVGRHGRILIDEFEQTRFNKYRNAESELPIQRYAGDYLPMETEKFEVPFLNDLTEEWLKQLINNNFILPEIKETLPVHTAMFDWLSASKKYKEEFPIT